MKSLYKVKRKSQLAEEKTTINKVYAYNKDHAIDILINQGYIASDKDVISVSKEDN